MGRTQRLDRALRWLTTGALLGACACASAASKSAAPAAAAGEAMQAREPGAAMAPPAWVARAMDRRLDADSEVAAADAADDAGADGWASRREFPAPSYDEPYDGPRVDFRDTIYWSPSVRTDSAGQAEVDFYLSDAVTSFRATAEGLGNGAVGVGTSSLVSTLPLSVSVRLPVAVTVGDRIRLPIRIENTTDKGLKAELELAFGESLQARTRPPNSLWVSPRRPRTVHVTVEVTSATAPATVEVAVRSRNLEDRIQRTVHVVPTGFPVERHLAGTLERKVVHEIDLPEGAEGPELVATFYPSPTSTVLEGAEALIAEPHGCFEQASSANYPNVMVLSMLAANDSLDPELERRSRGALEQGYAKLTGYETSKLGFEWFGESPGHEALTAYGIMQFSEMKEVFPEFDEAILERTSKWLMKRRDGAGGFKRDLKALDSFGRASAEVTDTYITYALISTGRRDLEKEVARVRRLCDKSSDPYILALAANTLLHIDPSDRDADAVLQRLAAVQDKDGRLGGADHSITYSTGKALDIETTALYSLALMRATRKRPRPLQRALAWIRSQRQGSGAFASTQATILALKALTESAESGGSLPPEARVRILVNGEQVALMRGDDAASDALIFSLGRHLHGGKNRVEIESNQALTLPYAMGLRYRQTAPAVGEGAAVFLVTRMRQRRPRVGQSVRLTATIANETSEGLPMVIARVGIPGGLEVQSWQLDELVERGRVDFYETREREVILYYRSMAPRAKKSVDIELLAAVEGRYSAPPSTAYLYYTDEKKYWTAGTVSVIRPATRAKRSKSDAR